MLCGRAATESPTGVKRDLHTRFLRRSTQMDTPDTALRGQNTTAGGRLYMAFELGEKNWKLSLGDGQRAPSRCTVAAGDATAALPAIANPRARWRLGPHAPAHSCYEGGPDGFLLHRWAGGPGLVYLAVADGS